MNDPQLMEKLVNLSKQRGFLFQSSEIYGGLNSFYDYGPLGVELKNNIKRAWWKTIVQERSDVVGQDAAILMHPKTWEASGHIQNFTDPLVEDKVTHKRYRADHLVEKQLGVDTTKLTVAELGKLIVEKNVKSPDGNELTEPKQFNLMFKTFMGPTEEAASVVYLRPETAQGIFVNYKNIKDSLRLKLPFGIAQIGKSFRNEITPGNFIFRTREFEQMELEFFCSPQEADTWFAYWTAARLEWYTNVLGLKKENLRLRPHEKTELAHYAKACSDVEFNFPFGGWSELEGIANRQDYDLKQHEKFSGEVLDYTDPDGKKFTPFVIEPSAGADRSVLAVLVDAYDEIEGGRSTTTESTKEKEVVMRFSKHIAPIKIAILPLSKKEPLTKTSQELFATLSKQWMCQYDETASIGRRYRRQDEIGTPYCITVDFETAEDGKVTVRDRDTMAQSRVAIAELTDYFSEQFK